MVNSILGQLTKNNFIKIFKLNYLEKAASCTNLHIFFCPVTFSENLLTSFLYAPCQEFEFAAILWWIIGRNSLSFVTYSKSHGLKKTRVC